MDDDIDAIEGRSENLSMEEIWGGYASAVPSSLNIENPKQSGIPPQNSFPASLRILSCTILSDVLEFAPVGM